ncbi:hypothetical protein BDZ89DRAFT_1075367 [Hymenopellis radicata]|nr:hypothetical protein BDZ89DRAFT_1075367 [Hymenopellis radicata]
MFRRKPGGPPFILAVLLPLDNEYLRDINLQYAHRTPPPTVFQLIADPAAVEARFPPWPVRADTWRVSNVKRPKPWTSSIPFWPSLLTCLCLRPRPPPGRDTPLAAFYRIYQFLIVDSKLSVRLRGELEYFCRGHPEWAPATYAALAGLARLMCGWFNRRISFGLPRDAPTVIMDLEQFVKKGTSEKSLESEPSWVAHVRPMRKAVYIPDAEGKTVENKKDVCEIMKKMGIIMREPHIYFI